MSLNLSIHLNVEKKKKKKKRIEKVESQDICWLCTCLLEALLGWHITSSEDRPNPLGKFLKIVPEG